MDSPSRERHNAESTGHTLRCNAHLLQLDLVNEIHSSMAADKFRFTTVTAVVVANMVGTGVFTSLGFQLLDIQSGFAF